MASLNNSISSLVTFGSFRSFQNSSASSPSKINPSSMGLAMLSPVGYHDNIIDKAFYSKRPYISIIEVGLEIDNIVLTKLDQLDNKNTITEK